MHPGVIGEASRSSTTGNLLSELSFEFWAAGYLILVMLGRWTHAGKHTSWCLIGRGPLLLLRDLMMNAPLMMKAIITEQITYSPYLFCFLHCCMIALVLRPKFAAMRSSVQPFTFSL